MIRTGKLPLLMGVPDHVVFGRINADKAFTYGDVRGLAEAQQFEAIQTRLQSFYFAQVDEVATKAYAPFPLFLMLCVGIETIGEAFFSRDLKEKESKEEMQKAAFLLAAARVHQKFGRPLGKDQFQAFDEIWGEGEHRRVATLGLLFYRLGRNTMIHGFQGRGVQVTADDKVKDLLMENGCLLINPWTVWTLFKTSHDNLWKDFFRYDEDHPYKKSMRRYRDQLLN